MWSSLRTSPPKTADILSFATLILLLKKDVAAREELKRRKGATYVQPQRHIGTGMTIVKVACNCALLQFKDAMGPVVGSAQFAVEPKAGFTLLQWAI